MRTNEEYAHFLRVARNLDATISYVDDDGMFENRQVQAVTKTHAWTMARDEDGKPFGEQKIVYYGQVSWIAATIGGDPYAQATSGRQYR